MYIPNPFAYAIGLSGLPIGGLRHNTIVTGNFPGANDFDLRAIAPQITSTTEDELRAALMGSEPMIWPAMIPIYSIENDPLTS